MSCFQRKNRVRGHHRDEGEQQHDEGGEEPTTPDSHDKSNHVEAETPDQSGSIIEFFSNGGPCCACGGGLEGVKDEGADFADEEEEEQSSVQELQPMPPQKYNHTGLRMPRLRAAEKMEEEDFF